MEPNSATNSTGFALANKTHISYKEYLEWKRLLHHYYRPFPVVEHYKTIIEDEKSNL